MTPEGQEVSLWVTAMWDVPDNPKRSPQHYRRLIPRTARLLHDSRCEAWVDSPRWGEYLAGALTSAGVDQNMNWESPSSLVPQRLQQAVAKNASRRLHAEPITGVSATSLEKDTVHFVRDLTPAGIDTYTSLVQAWLAKVFAVLEAISRNKIGRLEVVGWVDASFSRFLDPSLPHVEFSPTQPVSSGRLTHVGNIMTHGGKPLDISATVMIGSVATWRWLGRAFLRAALHAYKDNYLHDEETILNLLVGRFPHRFRRVDLMDLVAGGGR